MPDATGSDDGEWDPRGTEPSTAFPVPWSPLDAVGAFVLSLLAISLIGNLVLSAGAAAGWAEDVVQVVLLPISAVLLAASTVLVAWARGRRQVWKLGGPLRPQRSEIAVGLGFGLAAYVVINIGLSALFQVLAEATGTELPTVQPSFREAAQNSATAPLFAVAAVLVTPFAEELLYRGMLFQSLRARLGLWPGIGLSALAFTLGHLSATGTTQSNLLVFVAIFPLGMAFAWIFHRRGTLLVPVLAHMVFNSVGVVALVLLDA